MKDLSTFAAQGTCPQTHKIRAGRRLTSPISLLWVIPKPLFLKRPRSRIDLIRRSKPEF